MLLLHHLEDPPFICFYLYYSRRWVKKDLALIYVKEGSTYFFSSKSFTVLSLTFRSLIHFEFIFVYGVRECSNHSFTGNCPVFPRATYRRDCLLLIVYSCNLCHRFVID